MTIGLERYNHCLVVVTGAYKTKGGIAAVNRIMIQCLAERFDLDIFVLNEDNKEIINLPQTVHTIKYSVFNKNKICFTLALWNSLIRNKYSYIFCDHVNLASALAPFSKLGYQYYVWLFGIEVYYPNPSFEGLIGLKSAFRCLAISKFTADHVQRRFPAIQINVCELSLGSEWDPFNPRRIIEKTIPLQDLSGNWKTMGQFMILHVGQMNLSLRDKGQIALINAFPLILKEFTEAQLVLVGEGASLDHIRNQAAQLPCCVQERIFIPGYIPEEILDRLYEQCYLFAMPSQGEGFGLVYLEAFVHSKPCIGSKSAAIPEIIKDGVTGLLVNNPNSPEEVAEKISWLFSHPEEANRMGHEGYKKVITHHLFPHFKERFWHCINQAAL